MKNNKADDSLVVCDILCFMIFYRIRPTVYIVMPYAVITIAIRLRHDYDTTKIRLRRIACACFQFDASKK